MNTPAVRRWFVVVSLLLAPLFQTRAEQFWNSTYINFATRGYGTYDMWFLADLVVGGDSYATAYAGFGSLYGTSFSYIGEAGVGMYLSNIQRIGGTWTAESVIVYAFSNVTGQYEYTYYYNYPLPTAGWVNGQATCDGYYSDVRGYIYGYGPPPNDPPVPSVSVVGRTSGAEVTANTVLTVNHGATDPNQNLSGIRYNVWYKTENNYDNNGGAYVPQSGESGVVTRTVAPPYSGDWYFWTDARDAAGATASTPAWSSAFRIFVRWGTPCYEPQEWSTCRIANNCYNYANNRQTDTFAQPGNGGGTTFNLYNQDVNQVISELRAAAIADGLELTDAGSSSLTGKTKIALVLWPEQDFHWYRQDCNGRWSHKRGEDEPTNLDFQQNPILSPEAADRGPYTVFVGYFFTPSDAIQRLGHANIY